MENGMENENTKKKPHPKLTDVKLKEIKDTLLAKIQEIKGDVMGLREEGLNNTPGGGNSTPLHFAELGTDTFNQNFALSRLEHEEELLGQIYDAIERIDNGEFGLCQICGGPMKVARLEFSPWVPNCITCQEKLESYN